ncbi:hypothetical protein BC629DRAFT_1436044 [Irpex lacteus]|nr:hypothetical protein BC629DRAFT_1436044 [Irpex lacteus]
MAPADEPRTRKSRINNTKKREVEDLGEIEDSPTKKLKSAAEKGGEDGSDSSTASTEEADALQATPSADLVAEGETNVGPTLNRLEYDLCDYIPETFRDTRMNSGGRAVNNALGYYYAKDITLNAKDYKWGNEFLKDRHGKLLVVCLIVRIKSTKFYWSDNQGKEHICSWQYLKFSPLRQADRETIEFLTCSMQEPPTEPEGQQSFRAGKWATKRGESADKAKCFDNCWDSPVECNSKTNGQISATGLGANDIVFLEVLVRRWPTKGDTSAPAGGNGGYWGRGWKTGLDLHRIFRMLKAPSDAPIDYDSDNELAALVYDG